MSADPNIEQPLPVPLTLSVGWAVAAVVAAYLASSGSLPWKLAAVPLAAAVIGGLAQHRPSITADSPYGVALRLAASGVVVLTTVVIYTVAFVIHVAVAAAQTPPQGQRMPPRSGDRSSWAPVPSTYAPAMPTAQLAPILAPQVPPRDPKWNASCPSCGAGRGHSCTNRYGYQVGQIHASRSDAASF